MATILASNALSTTAALNNELNLNSDSEGPQDNAVERVINEASDFVARFCDVTFERQDGIVEKVKGYGGNSLRLNRRPILTVTTVAIDGAVIDPTTYVIEDADRGKLYAAAGWPSTARRAPGISQGPMPRSEDPQRIVVTYSAGYVTPFQNAQGLFSSAARTLPWDLEGAVIRLATMRWRQRGRSAQEVARSFEASGVTMRQEGIPPDIMATLRQYKRFAQG